MYFAERLYMTGVFVVDLGIEISRIANRIRLVYLIGTYLYAATMDTGLAVANVGRAIIEAAIAFYNVYHELRAGMVISYALQRLIDWSNAIIDFISNPFPFVINIVRSAWGGIDAVLHSTYAFILPHVLQIIYNNFGFLRDMTGFVNSAISTIIPFFTLLRSDPARWVFERITAFSAIAGRILTNPDDWLRERIGIFYPALIQFLDNPAEFILNKFEERLEVFADRHMGRIIKIAENILSAIF